MRNSRSRKKILRRNNPDYALAIQHLKDMASSCAICALINGIVKELISKGPRKVAHRTPVLNRVDGGKRVKQSGTGSNSTMLSSATTCL